MPCTAVWVIAIILKDVGRARPEQGGGFATGLHPGSASPASDPGKEQALNSSSAPATDPYTLAADRRFAQWMKDEERRETVRLAANRTNLAKGVAAPRA